jgi:hypothetical protein
VVPATDHNETAYEYDVLDSDGDNVVDSTTTYEYDDNGSTESVTTGTDVKKYVWDLRNRLVGLDANGDDDLDDPGDATFAYDHEGTRVRRSVNIDTDEDGITDAQDETHFLQDKNNHTGCSQVLEEKSSLTAAPDRSYLIGHDIIAQAVAATVHHLLYDAGGSTRGLLDATGQFPS